MCFICDIVTCDNNRKCSVCRYIKTEYVEKSEETCEKCTRPVKFIFKHDGEELSDYSIGSLKKQLTRFESHDYKRCNKCVRRRRQYLIRKYYSGDNGTTMLL